MTTPEVYATVQRWLKKLRTKSRSPNFDTCATKKAALFWLKKYIEFLKKGNQNLSPDNSLPTDPDNIIRDREKSQDSDREAIKRSHEEWVMDFSLYLQNVKTKETPNGYAPKSVCTAVGMVRSFYKTNYYPLKEIALAPPRPVREFKVPTTKGVKKMCDYADPEIKTWILCQKDSGLRIGDLLGTTFDRRSREFGTIEQQLKKDQVPIHVEFSPHSATGKTGSSVDTFFGPNAIEAIKENIPITRSGRIFKMCTTSIQQRIKRAAIRAKVGTKDIPVTSHSLRKFFSTRLKGDEMQEALVESMMGHSIGAVRSAYYAPVPSEIAKVYMKHYHAIDIHENKNASNTSTLLEGLKQYLPEKEFDLLVQTLANNRQ